MRFEKGIIWLMLLIGIRNIASASDSIPVKKLKKWAAGTTFTYENYPLTTNNAFTGRPKPRVQDYGYIEHLDLPYRRNTGTGFGYTIERYFFEKNELALKFSQIWNDKGEYYEMFLQRYAPPGNIVSPVWGYKDYISYQSSYFKNTYYFIDFQIQGYYSLFRYKKFVCNLSVGKIWHRARTIVLETYRIKNDELKSLIKLERSNYLYESQLKKFDFNNYTTGLNILIEPIKSVQLSIAIQISNNSTVNFTTTNNNNYILEMYETGFISLYNYQRRKFFLTNQINLAYAF